MFAALVRSDQCIHKKSLMGHDKVTVKNLVVAYIDVENNLIGLKGAVPGPKKGLISIGGKA